jgi:hypothetical protein
VLNTFGFQLDQEFVDAAVEHKDIVESLVLNSQSETWRDQCEEALLFILGPAGVLGHQQEVSQ